MNEKFYHGFAVHGIISTDIIPALREASVLREAYQEVSHDQIPESTGTMAAKNIRSDAELIKVFKHDFQFVNLLFCMIMPTIPFIIGQLFFNIIQPNLCRLVNLALIHA